MSERSSAGVSLANPDRGSIPGVISTKDTKGTKEHTQREDNHG